MTARSRRRAVHKVGLTAAAIGLSSFLLPFATVSRSRIASGTPVGVADALSLPWLALVVVPWLVVALLSLRAHGYQNAFARGVLAALEVAALLCASGQAAGPQVRTLGMFARYSLGSGVWLGIFAAFALVVSSRRELGTTTARAWLVTLAGPVAVVALIAAGRLSDLGMAAEYRNVADRFGFAVLQHIAYAASAIAVASVLGVLLGVWAFRSRRFERPIFAVVSVFQTIPGLAMIGILVAPLAAVAAAFPAVRAVGFGGLGWAPLVLALTLYALLAVVGNTYAGLAAVPDAVVEAGRGMGMSRGQLLRRVQLPLARPVLFSGVRTASQQTVGNATLGAFVAAGGLGPFIFLGLAQQANDLVLLGSVALVTLALVVDMLMRGLQQLVTPRNLRKGRAE